ncbi:MAG: DUF2188 domain-containing protein [Clostridia bacterium]|nr:DUF2188 domain-containing protein [Clostridia bacterium]
MESFKNFMTDTKFLLPNWSWIAIALVVAAVVIIIACSIAAGRKKKHGHSADETAVEIQPENGEKTETAEVGSDNGFDKLIEPFYPTPESAVIYEGATVETDEVTAPEKQPVEENVQAVSEEDHEEKEEPAEEIEYRSEQVAAPEHVDEVTYSAVVTPVVEGEENPVKKTAAKKTTTAKKSTAKSTAKKPAAKKASTAKKPAPKKTETKTVKLVKEEEEVKQPEPVKAEAAKPAKKTTAKPAAKKPAETKASAKAKPAKSDSIPKVSAVLTEDIPEPTRTEPEVAPVKPVAKQTVLKTEDKKAAKKPAAKKTDPVKAETAKAELKKAAAKKPAAAKPAAAKPAAKKPAPKKAEIADVSQKVAKSTPKGPEKIYHVSRRPQDNKWEVRLEGSSKAIKLFRTKAEAMDYAIPLAGDDSDNSRVIIHKADGRPKNVAFL